MSEFAIRRPVSVLMLCIGLVALGLIAAMRIPMQLMPNIVTPEFTLVTQFKGATPEEVENFLTAPLERAVSTVSGLLRTESVSERERSEIRLKFSSSADLLETISALRDKLDSVSLPDGTARPKIMRFQSNSEPVVRVAFIKASDTLSTLELSRFMQEILLRKVEAVEGVAMATLLGAPSKEIEVELDPVAAQAYGVNVTQIPEIIQSKNKSYPAGEILHEGRKIGVKLGQGLSSIAELKELIVKKDEERILRLADIAKIKEIVVDSAVKTHLQGSESLVVEVRKEAESNAVDVARRVKEVIATFLEENADKVHGLVLYDQGKEIQTAIDGVKGSVRDGGILAALIIFILMQAGWPTFVISLSIPLSLMLALVMMYFTGITFNLMSLAGLALGVGMLVDNSTVVLQSINNEYLNSEDPREAALWGARKVAGAITGSTLTSIAVFAPLAFVEGTIGQMFRDVAATVSYSMLASLFVALIVIPMLSSVRMSPRLPAGGLRFNFAGAVRKLSGVSLYGGTLRQHPLDFFRKCSLSISLCAKVLGAELAMRLGSALKRFFGLTAALKQRWLDPPLSKVSVLIARLEETVARILPLVMVDSKKTLRIAVLSTVAGVAILALKGAELFPDEGVDRLVYDVEYVPGQTADRTEMKIGGLEKLLLELDDVHTVSSVIGAKGSHTARLVINANNSKGSAVVGQANSLLSSVPGLNFDRVKEAMVGQGKPVQIEIYQDELVKLKDSARRAVQVVRGISGLVDVESDIRADISEVNVNFLKNKLGWYGVDSQSFVSPLRAMIMGQNGGMLQIQGDDVPLRITTPPAFFGSIDKLRSFGIEQEDKRVYLSQVSDIAEDKAMGTIRRFNRKRVAVVSANLSGTDLESASRKVKRALDREFKNGEVSWKIGGQDEERKKSEKSLVVAILLSVFLIYLMLAAQFESLVQPLVILCAVPLCLSGVAISLVVFNMNMSAMVFVGLILLVGVSINTSIVMVDFANQLLLEGRSVREAIIEGTVKRLRPIIVTMASNILGLVPMVLSLEQGSAMQRPLAVTLIGGHISSTLLTIIAVPIIYERLTKGQKLEHAT